MEIIAYLFMVYYHGAVNIAKQEMISNMKDLECLAWMFKCPLRGRIECSQSHVWILCRVHLMRISVKILMLWLRF